MKSASDNKQQTKVTFRKKEDLVTLPKIPNKLMDDIGIFLEREINGRNSIENKISAIYAAMQRFADEFVSSFSVCQKGCSHCCKYDVAVGRLEAEYISLKTNKNIDIGNSITTNHDSDCPFLLKNGVCGIYEYRPVVCRTLHALDDPSYCSTPDIPHQLYGVSGGFGVSFYENVQRALFMLTDSVGAPRGKRDIRDWFPD